VGFSKSLFEGVAGRCFIDFRRLWKVVNVDYLVDGVLAKAIDFDGPSLYAGVPIFVSLTDATSGQPRHVVLTQGNGPALAKATMAIPTLYGRKVKLFGRRYVDGGIADPIPLFAAKAQFPDALPVTVLTSRLDDIPDQANGIEKLLVALDRRNSLPIVRLLVGKNRLAEATKTELLADANGSLGFYAEPRGRDATVSRTLTDQAVLQRIMASGVEDGRELEAAVLSAIATRTRRHTLRKGLPSAN
jgi:predicted patatin/cPLA2 family phospholipase